MQRSKRERAEGIRIPEGPPPKTINSTRKINGVLHVAGQGNKDADIMFIALHPYEEEAETEITGRYGDKIKTKPRYLKGPAGTMFSDLCERCGIRLEDAWYTAMLKWYPDAGTRGKPKAEQIEYAWSALEAEIKTVKPKIIVCLGSPVFKQFVDFKIKLSEIAGGWFRNEKYDCLLYPMDDPYKLVTRPERFEAFHVDIKEVSTMLRQVRNIEVPKVEQHYQIIENSQQLRQFVADRIAEGCKIASLDCEWHGRNHITAKLRSTQLSWAAGYAVYIRFMDEAMEYVFDVPYKEAGAILAPWLDQPDVKYVGHHASADLPMIHHWLGLNWYGKVFMDTEFAQQVCDEAAELKLERLAMAYTDLGRYDIDLTIWKKKNGKLVNEQDGSSGYGRVPEEIIFPYACKDVDSVMRIWPILLLELRRQKLEDYYFKIFNPFVTDVFTSFALFGLPVNMEKLDFLRDTYNTCKGLLETRFRGDVYAEALELLRVKCQKEGAGDSVYRTIVDACAGGDYAAAMESAKGLFGVANIKDAENLVQHLIIAPTFNIRSTDHMRRWLFGVKGYEPIKSTANKENGMPSIPWEKVLDFPPSKQKEFKPSVDKQTLKLLAYAHEDSLLMQLLRLNAVGNICKAFLKEGTRDSDGRLVRERGLHEWVAPDERVHGMFSTTETGRPRAWNPNSLNWPSWVNGAIAEGMREALEDANPDEVDEKILDVKDTGVPAVRACVEAPEGWCIVESDYSTAELRGQAFVSGDAAMIRLFTEKDPCFAYAKYKGEETVIRVNYPEDGSILDSEKEQKFLFAVVEKGEPVSTVEEADLVRNSDGSIKHYKYDLHWSLAERVHGTPREKLNAKKDRGAAKTGNFSSAYGATGETLERKIEEDTGIKPEPGTGDKILAALRARQPQAVAFLEYLESKPKDPGYYRAQSGRIRHFHTFSDDSGVSKWQRSKVESALGREARNFPFQESVAATAARATTWCLDFAIRNNLQGRPAAVLYDAMVIMCPEEERFLWLEAQKLFMFLTNGWEYHGRVLRYPIDTDMSKAWSDKPTKEYAAKLADRSYSTPDERLQRIEQKLKEQVRFFEENEKEALRFSKEKSGLFPVNLENETK